MINKLDVKIKKVRKEANIFKYANEFAAGADLCACLDESITIKPKESVKITTGLSIEIPTGFAGFIFARSGIATKYGIAPVNKVGVIDSDYRGELCVFLYNQSNEEYVVNNGDRIAQLVIMPYVKANFIEAIELSETERGSQGFGSTGIN